MSQDLEIDYLKKNVQAVLVGKERSGYLDESSKSKKVMNTTLCDS